MSLASCKRYFEGGCEETDACVKFKWAEETLAELWVELAFSKSDSESDGNGVPGKLNSVFETSKFCFGSTSNANEETKGLGNDKCVRSSEWLGKTEVGEFFFSFISSLSFDKSIGKE